MDHTHAKGQKNCSICLENNKDYWANQMYVALRRASDIARLKMEIAMIKLFDTPKLKPKIVAPKVDGTRPRTPGRL